MLVEKNLPASAGDARDVGWIPGLRRFSEGGNGNLLQYSCLENFMGRRARWATVHGATESGKWYEEWRVIERLSSSSKITGNKKKDYLGCVRVTLKVAVFLLMVFSGYMPRNSIAESYGSSIFHFLRKKWKWKSLMWLFATPLCDCAIHGILQARILEPFPPPGDLHNPGIKPRSPALRSDSLPAEPQWKPISEGNSILLFIVAVSIYIATNKVRGFPSLHTYSSIYCF